MTIFMSKNIRLTLLVLLTSSVVACSDSQKTLSKQEPITSQENVIKVTNWGPKSTKVGQGFLLQANGDSVIWFEFTGPADANRLEVWFGDQKLTSVAVVPGKGGSATVPPKLFSKAGNIPVYLIYTATGAKVEIGTFEISP